MTSQQLLAIVASADLSPAYPTLHYTLGVDADRYERAIAVLEAAGATVEREWTDVTSGTLAPGYESAYVSLDGGRITLTSVEGHNRPEPIAALADVPTPISDDDRIDITDAGRSHLRVLAGGAE